MKLTDLTVSRMIPAAAEKVFDVWNTRRVPADRGSEPST